jgi:hypothetical protein
MRVSALILHNPRCRFAAMTFRRDVQETRRGAPCRPAEIFLEESAVGIRYGQKCPLQYPRQLPRLRLGFAQPFKPTQWAVVAVIWAGIALTLATQHHLRETALKMHFAWSESFRFPTVECLFWFLLTPLLFWLVRRSDLFSRDWPRHCCSLWQMPRSNWCMPLSSSPPSFRLSEDGAHCESDAFPSLSAWKHAE